VLVVSDGVKLAAIDCGTNSFHLIVARVTIDGSIEVVERAKEMVRIGDSAFRGGMIAPDAFEHGTAALRAFRTVAERHGCEAVVAVATSAVREAQNGAEFIRELSDATGLEVEVIGGDEEARLIYLGVRSALDFAGRKALIVDIGGGSVELVVGDARESRFRASFKLGVLRLLAERISSDPISPAERARLVAHCHRTIEAVAPAVRAIGFDFLAMTSGTANAVADLAAAHKGLAATAQKSRKIAFADVHALEEIVCNKTAAERAKLPGMDPRRIDSIVPGVILVRTILETFHADEVTLCDAALREGMIADWVGRNRPGIQLIEEFPELRRRSVVGLARRSGYHRAHAEHTARLALDIFRGTRALHNLSNADGELLEFAALLHDIGYHISPKGHHKHGAYLIASADMKGFAPDEIAVLAQTVRYHRKATPKEGHEGFAALAPPARRKVRILAGILRLADGLDRSYGQIVRHVLCDVSEKAVTLRLTVTGDPALEIWGARRKRDLFEEAFGRKLRLEVIDTPTQETAGAGGAATPAVAYKL
jgi:exopolyphosphatase/guanosine-5'-triphosphate,3'-diphosphate pyrophosphatase